MAAPIQVLRVVAGVGVGVVLLQEAVTALPLKPRQEYGVAVLVLALVAVAVAFAFLMPGMVGTLLRHKDLLVPLGLLTLADAVLGWLTLLPVLGAVLAPSTVLKLCVLSFSISVAFVISILLQVAYSAWTTTKQDQFQRERLLDRRLRERVPLVRQAHANHGSPDRRADFDGSHARVRRTRGRHQAAHQRRHCAVN